MSTVAELPQNETGVRCSRCGCRHLPVIPGATRHFRTFTRHKRRCRHCGKVLWTKTEIVGTEGESAA